MFRSWCERQNIPHVAKSCLVSPGTVKKFRRVDNWDARLKVVKTKAADILDDDVAKDTARKLKVLKNVENVYLTSLIGHTKCEACGAKVPVPKLKPNFKDITEIYRYDDLLRGKPDSRPDLGRMYDQLSDDQLDQLCQQSIDEICDRLRSIASMRKMVDMKSAINEMLNELG